MSIQLRLTVMNFMQFFVWGAWLISLGAYMIVTLGFSGGQVGSIYATMGIASLFMPGLMGIVADRWVNAERLYGILHLTGAGLLLWASTVRDFDTLYMIMLLNAMVYMPTIALNNTVSFKVLEQGGLNVIQKFPPIRVWGTVGFIVSMWMVDFAGWTKSALQLYISAAAAVFLGLYGFTMPKCPPAREVAKKSIVSALGLDAFVLFRRTQMLVFFLFAMMLGAALQITNAFGGAFLADFSGTYPDSFGVLAPEHPDLDLADLRDALHPDNPVLPAALRHQGRDADQHRRLGVSIRPVRHRRSRPRPVDARAVDDHLRHGLRFLQHFGLAVRGPRGGIDHPRERAGPVHGDDQRPRRVLRQHGGGHGRGPFHRGRREGLAEHLVHVRRLRARARDSCSRSHSSTGTSRGLLDKRGTQPERRHPAFEKSFDCVDLAADAQARGVCCRDANSRPVQQLGMDTALHAEDLVFLAHPREMFTSGGVAAPRRVQSFLGFIAAELRLAIETFGRIVHRACTRFKGRGGPVRDQSCPRLVTDR